jgi:integrase
MLTDLQIRTAKAEKRVRKLTDGGGLQLWVLPSGSKQWRLAYRFGGKQRLLALGAYPLFNLAAARRKRDEAKLQLASGIDPMEDRRQEKAKITSSFDAIADEFIKKRERDGRAAVTLAKTRWLLDMARPALGKLPIETIKAKDVYQVLKKIEDRGTLETAHRLKSTIGAVFRFAMATGRAEVDPTIALRGALARQTVRSHAAITCPNEVGALMRAIQGYEGQLITRIALELMALLFPRPGELRAAEWKEFDFKNAIWTIPAVRTKMRRPHQVPLAPRALALLEQLWTISGEFDLAFPAIHASERPMCENTLNAALRRLGYGQTEATSHGFRATAATLLNESRRWHPDAIERQLAHMESNAVRRAYTRGEHWDERVRMMHWWADYLAQLRNEIHPTQAGPLRVAA